MRRSRVAAVAVVVALLALAWRFGVFAQFESPARARDTLLGFGAWGYLAFVLAYAVLQPFGVPGTVFIMVAPLIWPWPTAFALSMVGTMAASVVGFSFARFVAQDWFSTKIPARMKRYETALEQNGFTTVFLLRLLLWMPPWLHAFFGISRVSFWKHFWGSAAGYAPTLLLVSYFGQQLFDWMKNAPTSLWVGLAAGAVVIGLTVWLLRRRAVRARSLA